MLKRAFDLFLSILLILIFTPLLIVLAILIRVKMGSPVIFKQQRPGLKAKPFYLYKFRTMNEIRASKSDHLTDEARLTVLGRWLRRYSLDELPQLINVLKGELSFVGPRPLLMEYLPCYSKEQARRHDVKPGITGWAQVNGRNAITWEEKFEHDIWYVDNRSFILDLKILWQTFIKVVSAEGISPDDHTIMPRFTGNKTKKKDRLNDGGIKQSK